MRNPRDLRAGVSPKQEMVPPLGRRTPESIRIMVDLPAPFGPSRATDSPAETRNETSSTARPLPVFDPRGRRYARLTRETSITGELSTSFRITPPRLSRPSSSRARRSHPVQQMPRRPLLPRHPVSPRPAPDGINREGPCQFPRPPRNPIRPVVSFAARRLTTTSTDGWSHPVRCVHNHRQTRSGQGFHWLM